MNELVKYDAACRAVAEAASIDEAKEFRDQSEAMRAYARQAKNKQMEAQAAEIRFRAERRIGELMEAQREGGHMSRGAAEPGIGKRGSETNPRYADAPPSLEEVGIDKKTADRARKYAAIPEDEFNGIVGDWRERVEAENARVTVDLLAAGKKAQDRSQIGAEAEPEPEPEPTPDPYGYANLTDEALLETANGLRADLDEEKARRKTAEAERDDMKARLEEALADDDMGRALGNAQRQRDTARQRMKDEQAKNARLQRRVDAQDAEIKKLRKQLERQEVEL
jgi:hypothetical protein